MFRGATASLIYSRSLEINSKYNELTAVTLMSTDVDRVTVSLHLVNEIWARLIEIGLGVWLLWRQLGVVSLAPIFIVIGKSIHISSKLCSLKLILM
jgi:ATP-binding cassette subfamily C (CFTR/MRP) protein 1